MSNGLYQRNRPKKFQDVVGQDKAVAQLKGMIKSGKVPRALLFSGPSGTGKTTLVRILSKYLKCADRHFNEFDCASNGGIDVVRDIRKACVYKPLQGDCIIFYIDEAHGLSRQAQEALLKILEDGPDYCYFIFATTQPQQLHKTVFTRTTEIKLGPVKESDLVEVIQNAAKAENVEVHHDVAVAIAESAENSPRKSLVILEQVLSVEGREAQLSVARSVDAEKSIGIELARCLSNTSSTWAQAAEILKNLDDDPEGVRHLILSYANSCLLSQKNPKSPFAMRQYKILECFSETVMYTKKNGLSKAAYEVIVL